MVEILMSTYNGSKYIKEQIESILSQTYDDWHLLIRDDGSSDTTVDIIKEYQEKYPDKIKFLNRRKNLGALHSFEELLNIANATYYMFCDQDDVWLPNKIKNAITSIKEIEKPGLPAVVYSDLCVVDEKLQKINSSFFESARIVPRFLQKKEELAVNNYAAGCTMLFNDDAKKVSLPFGKYATMHDSWVLLSVLTKVGIIKQIPSIDILYRQHGRNVCGAYQVDYNFKYLVTKIKNFKSVIRSYKSMYLQANELFGMSICSFCFQRIKYLCKR